MNDFEKITLLTEGQVWGDINTKKLEIFKKVGTYTPITDVGILTGGLISYEYLYNNDKLSINTLTQTLITYSNYSIRSIDDGGYKSWSPFTSETGVIRPIIISPKVSYVDIPIDRFTLLTKNKNALTINYGEYPQMSIDPYLEDVLETKYQKNELKLLNETYTFNQVSWQKFDKKFTPITYNVFEYENNKYIRMISNCYQHGNILSKNNDDILSNGKSYKKGNYAWILIKPVTWLIDEQTGILVSQKGLVSGIRFNSQTPIYNFESSEIYKFINKYMSHDLFQSESLENIQNNNNTKIKIKELVKLKNTW